MLGKAHGLIEQMSEDADIKVRPGRSGGQNASSFYWLERRRCAAKDRWQAVF
jgi:hypothetical protein